MEQEKLQAEKKKGKNGKIVALALALVLLVGGTYAWLTLTINGTKQVRIESGNLAMTISGESDGVLIDPAVPITENEGKTQNTKYDFTLENTGNVSSVYTVYLDDVALDGADEFAIDKTLVGYYLEKTVYTGTCTGTGSGRTCDGTADGETQTRTGNIQELLSNNYVVLDSSNDSTALAAGKYIKYTLRLWIKDTAGTDDLQKKENETIKLATYAAKIGVKATQIGIEADAAYGESAARPDTWVRPEPNPSADTTNNSYPAPTIP